AAARQLRTARLLKSCADSAMLCVAATTNRGPESSRDYDAGVEDTVVRRDCVPRESAEVAEPSASRGRRGAPVWAVASLMLLALAGVCTAADAPATAPAHTGKLLGMIAGLLLLALLCYSIYVFAAPILKERDRSLVWALAILCGVAIVKLALLPWFDGYRNDISSYESWALQMAAEGPAGIYRAGYFLDYPPAYLYALWLAGIVANATAAGGVMLRMIVEAPALVADFVLALLVFIFVRRNAPVRRTAAYLAMLLVAFNPALGFDTIVWGQSDSTLTVVIMLSAVLALDGEFELAWGLAVLSVLVKPQALMY